MTKKDFLHKLEELLQIEYSLNENMLLKDIEEYDSLALLSLSILYDQEFNIDIQGSELKSCKSIGDLIELIPGNKLES